jgi:FkbM family methyltransferase
MRTAIRHALKKTARSAQVLAPWLQEVRYTVQRRFLEGTGRTWRPEFEALRYLVMHDPVIVDVGASRGFSISAALMLKPGASVIAFEPLADLADALRQRYRCDTRVLINGVALGQKPGTLTIYTPIYRGCRLDSLSSLIYEEAANWPNAERFYRFDPSRLQVEEKHVAVFPLDQFDLKPDILKLYTEGSEIDVLLGAQDTIARAQPVIVAPARNPMVRAALADRGYAQYSFDGRQFCRGQPGDYWEWFLQSHHRTWFD